MSARIARGSSASSRRAPQRSGSRSKARKPQPGLLEGLPLSQRTLQRLTWLGGLFVALILVIAFAAAFRVPQRIGTAVGEGLGSAGFTMRHLEVRGLNRMSQSSINRVVYGQSSLAMALVDLDAIRDQLMAFPWIREARVSRRLPDTLVVEIEERSPAAIWQHNNRLTLVDAEGVELEPVQVEAMPNLPLLVGPGAQRRLESFNALTEAAPRLRPLLHSASWVGDRRWDLQFHTGETLSLPEGDDLAAAALRRFAEMDSRRQLLGGNFLRFDMRVGGRMIVRLREVPPAEGRVPAVSPGSSTQVPPAQGQAPTDLTRTI